MSIANTHILVSNTILLKREWECWEIVDTTTGQRIYKIMLEHSMMSECKGVMKKKKKKKMGFDEETHEPNERASNGQT